MRSFPFGPWLVVAIASWLLLVPAGARAADPAAEVRERYFEGTTAFDQGEYTKARLVWATLLKTHRSSLTPKQVQALQARIGQVDSLVAATEDRLPGQSYTDLALEALNRGASRKSANPKDPQAREQFDRAIVYLERAAGAGEQDKRYPYIMAYCLLYTDRLDSALTFARRAIETTPDDCRACNLAAEISRQRKNIDDYIDFLRKSLTCDDKQTEVHDKLCRTLLARDGQGDQAEAYDHAVAAVGGTDADRARELAGLFPRRDYRDKLESLASDIAIKAKLGRRRSVWQRR